MEKSNQMGKRDKLKGIDVRRVVSLANRGGQKAAAAELGVTQSSISRVLREHGYEPRIVYVKKEQGQ